MSPKQQKAMDDAAAAFAKKQRERTAELDALSVKKFKDAGCEVIELTDADRKAWQDQAKVAGVYDLVKSKMDHPEYLDQVLNKQY